MTVKEDHSTEEKKSLSFVEQLVEDDLAKGKNGGRIQTRFPPEPNGYLHIGHAKAICMDFGIAEKYNGVCNLRFDDTNPSKENNEYVENILHDISWLGFKWGNVYYASDYFEKLWDFAVWMIKQGLAYVDEQTSEEIAQQKGTPTTPGTASPYRNRPIGESLELFNKMNTPEAVEGSMVLRAKLDMANPNMHFRDPIIYRIIHIPITGQEPNGTHTPCTTSHMDRATISKVSPTLSVRSSLFHTDRCTTISSTFSRPWMAQITTCRTTVRDRLSSTG